MEREEVRGEVVRHLKLNNLLLMSRVVCRSVKHFDYISEPMKERFGGIKLIRITISK